MSASDKSKLDGIASSANNYSLPTASSSTLGGVKTGYSESGKNYKLQVDSSGNGYVNVPWTDTASSGAVYYIESSGQLGAMQTGTDKPSTLNQLRLYDQHSEQGDTGYPCNYSTALTFSSRAYHQLLFDYTSTSAGDRIYYRGKSDNDAISWSNWHTLAYLSDIPTKTSQLTNDSNYVTFSNVYTIEEVDSMVDDINTELGNYLKTYGNDDFNGITWIKTYNSTIGAYLYTVSCLSTDRICLNPSTYKFGYLPLTGGTVVGSTTYTSDVIVKSGIKLQSAVDDNLTNTVETNAVVFNQLGTTTDLKYNRYFYEDLVQIYSASESGSTQSGTYTLYNTSENFQGRLQITIRYNGYVYSYSANFSQNEIGSTFAIDTVIGIITYEVTKSNKVVTVSLTVPSSYQNVVTGMAYMKHR